MSGPELNPSYTLLNADTEALRDNNFPGCVIVMGRSKAANTLIQAYAITGRDNQSKNWAFVFEAENNGFRTVPVWWNPETKRSEIDTSIPFDPYRHYLASKTKDGVSVVSNGDQTEFVHHNLYRGFSLEAAVRNNPVKEYKDAGETKLVDLASYEQDEYDTPRITGVINVRPRSLSSFGLAVVRKSRHSEEPVYGIYEAPLEALVPGISYVVHTYANNSSNVLPLRAFDRRPYRVEIDGDSEAVANEIRDRLPVSKFAAVLAQTIDRSTGQIIDSHSISIHDPVAA